MTIKSSSEWQQKRMQLCENMRTISYNHDLVKMLAAIDKMITTLSKAEVEARRTHKSISSLDEYKAVISAIAQFEQYLIIAAFIG